MTTQDTRKDPRAKVLTMTVRYKSATLDEFIEHHSHDVSRGGMFIKTPSPFPPGTLLKFEVKIASEQRVMQGVGRVVWKREAGESNEVRPAGMGVKFIKIDDESRKVIDQLIDARGNNASNFDSVPPPDAVPAPPPAPAPPRPDLTQPPASAAAASVRNPNRKSTMMGLGAMTPTPPPSATKPVNPDSFFPEASFDQPAPEDRTVMKQAAELLHEALKGAGVSPDDVGTPAPPSTSSAKIAPAAPLPAAAPLSAEANLPKVVITEAAEPAKDASKPGDVVSTRLVLEPRADSARARMAVTQPATLKPPSVTKAPVTGAAASPARAAAAGAARSEPPRARSAAILEAAGPAPDTGGGGAKLLLGVIAAAAASVIVYFATRAPDAPPEPPPAPAAEAPNPEPAPEPAPEAPPPEPAAVVPEPAPSAAVAAPPAPALREPLQEAAPKPEPAVEPAPKPASKPAARPKPVERAPEVEPVPPVAETPPPAPKPAAPKPAPAPARKPAAPPKSDDGDNPY